MTDLRQRARIPYGYRIVDGKAVVDPAEAAVLKKYFDSYLSGLSMVEAGREAGLDCSGTTYGNILKRKEYAGTDYYPAIISEETQREILAERERRLTERKPRKPAPPKSVRIYTDFRMKKGPVPPDPSAVYQMIRPKTTPAHQKQV